MKQKIEIIGHKVHGVGYRYFLMNQAMLQGVDGFTALNQIDKNGLQKVWVIVEGSPEPVKAFGTFAQNERPIDAKVSEILIGDFEGFVPRIIDFALILTAGQVVKAIPIIPCSSYGKGCKEKSVYTFIVNNDIMSTSSVYSIRLPENICKLMKSMDDVNWSDEIREIVEKTVEDRAMERLLARAEERGKRLKKIDKSVAEMIREDRDAR